MNGENPQDRTGTGELDPARRAVFAQDLLRALAAYCPGSRAELRGSLARGTADAYSDIDIAWTVPDDRFDACLDAVREVLEEVVPLDSLRTDPDSLNSRERRLLFAAFRGLPLFWRVDLEVATAPVAGRPVRDRGDPAAHGDDWSRPASALANAVAATKAVLRGQPQNARGLLERGFRRIDAPDGVSGRWRADIRRLAEAAAGREPDLRPLADRVLRLAENHRAQLMWWTFPAGVRERVDELVLAGRDIQAAQAMRESGIEPRPELHECVEVLDGRHRALADRMPPPARPDVDAMAAAARALPRDPVAVEAVWDGDTRGWIVVLTAVLAGPWESVDLDGFRIGAAGTGEAARTGRALAERLGVPFRFASPDGPDEDAPRWWDARHRAGGSGR
ncbi:nucleotidyltransferase domain-containing protein [Streptomyces sp. NPDC127117]|uniref:nucleotidyltransferase domain-containing protein n=1 Tax=Streptomyces sp. NPDC127117 TaxID=3345368 RepID=UPI003641E142